MYDELIKRLINCASDTVEDCAGCPYQGGYKGTYCMNGLISEAGDAIEAMCEMVATAHGELSNVIQSYEESKPRWVPVTERLPEAYKPILLYNGEDIATGYMHSDKRFTVNGSHFPSRPTHWMPLPQPPEEG